TYHVVERLYHAQQLTYQRTVQPVAGRLASWLLEEHRRQGSTGRVALDLRRRDLAELLGMARETLSALLGRFADRGMVQYSWQQVRLVQLDLLAACAEGRVQIAAR
ncbi:MAG: Crp/Fnr family transcriptional regulator, partial [Dehalococcoidia bacterium]